MPWSKARTNFIGCSTISRKRSRSDSASSIQPYSWKRRIERNKSFKLSSLFPPLFTGFGRRVEANLVMADTNFTATELFESWPALSVDERVEGFELLGREEAEKFFLQLSGRDQAQMVLALPPGERRIWLRLLPPDEAVDLIQEAPLEERENLLQLLDDTTRREVRGLLVYAEDDAGGLMNPRYARLRPDMHVDEAISY